MSLLAIKSSKKKLTRSQSTYNRLVKRIEELQRNIQERETELHQGLQYYHSSVCPVKEEMLEKLPECIQVFYSYYRHPRLKLSKQERETLKELIQTLLNQLGEHLVPHEMSPEIIEIINDIEGINFKEVMDGEFDSLKKEFIEHAAKQGLNIDLSNVNFSCSREELIDELQKAMFEALEKKEEFDSKDSIKENVQEEKKTKQQLKKEQQAREVEEIQKKGLSKIYKQLAKALHPDLERDPLVKAEKEGLMKKLTTAYENQDLHTLLSLEIKWMNRATSNEDENPVQETEEKLKLYNMILRDQVEALCIELDCLWENPKYFDMRWILKQHLGWHMSSVVERLKEAEKKFLNDIKLYSSSIRDLKEGSNFKGLKQVLKDFSSEPDISEIMKFLFS